MKLSKFLAIAALAVATPLGLAACSDEDRNAPSGGSGGGGDDGRDTQEH